MAPHREPHSAVEAAVLSVLLDRVPPFLRPSAGMPPCRQEDSLTPRTSDFPC